MKEDKVESNIYIVFFVSSHGFGHMTRNLAIIENILNYTNYTIYIFSGQNQNNFAKIYLKKFVNKIIYTDIVNDIGFINKFNSLEIDKVLLEEKLNKFILDWESIISSEIISLENLNIKCIVSDISPLGCIIGKKLNVPVIFASNFTWIEQYEHIDIDTLIIEKFKEAYSFINKFIKYDLCLPMNSFDQKETFDIGFFCRTISLTRINEIRCSYGESIFITCGKSASLSSIKIKNFNGTIFTTSGIDIVSEKCNVVRLPLDILDTQNYISASEFVITKAGWGTIAEAIIGNTPLVMIERKSAKEDTFNIEEIKKRNLGISLMESELAEIDVLEFKKKLSNIDFKGLKSYKNNIERIVKEILL